MEPLSEIKQILDHATQNSLEEWYNSFYEETRRKDISGFLRYLQKNKLLGDESLRKLRRQLITVEEAETIAQSYLEGYDSHKLAPSSNPSDALRRKRENADTADQESRENHELLTLIGEGGMGNVFLAKQKLLGRRVAYKQLQPEKTREKIWLLRFLREVQITAQLDHPGIVPVYSLLLDEEDAPAYTMKVIEGQTLLEVINNAHVFYHENLGAKTRNQHKLFSLEARLECFLKVCDAMAYAHSKGVLHRDLKPSNIMIGRYHEVYVVDWGVARILFHDELTENLTEDPDLSDEQDDESKTRMGQLVGTLRYMSPEQAWGRHDLIDPRSDLYSLGLILFELVFMKPAILPGPGNELLQRVRTGIVQEPSSGVPNQHISYELKAVIQKALKVEPDERYGSVAEFAEDLRRCLRRQEVEAAPDNFWRGALRWVSQRLRLVLSFVFLVIFAVIGSNAWWYIHQQEQALAAELAQKATVKKLTKLTEQSYIIDKQFLRVESLLKQLASNARLAILQGRPSDEAYYLNRDFKPPDLKFSPFYRDKMSVSWPVLKLSPGIDEKASRSHIQQLNILRPYLKQTLFAWKHYKKEEGGKKLTKEERLRTKGMPLLSAFVASAKGMILLFPGRGSYPAKYDARQRPWFLAVKGKKHVKWSPPYVSSQKIRAVLMACTTAIRDVHNNFLGVVGIDIRLNYIAELLTYLKKQTPWIEEAMLLNMKGKILMRSGLRFPRYRGMKMVKKALKMPYYRNQTFLKHISQGRSSGYFYQKSKKDKGQKKLVAYTKLQTLPWYYLVISKPNKK